MWSSARVLGSCTAQQRDRHRGDTRYRTLDPGGGGGSQGVVVPPPLSCSGGRRHCLPGPWSPSPATRAGQGKTPFQSKAASSMPLRTRPAGGRPGLEARSRPRSPRPRGGGQRDAPGTRPPGGGGAALRAPHDAEGRPAARFAARRALRRDGHSAGDQRELRAPPGDRPPRRPREPRGSKDRHREEGF